MCLKLKQYFQEKKARKVVLKMDDFTIDSKVKIQGTNYDRKRKYTKEFFNQLKSEYNNGATIKELATKYSMNQLTIKYNIDSQFRAQYNAKRKKGTHAVGVLDFDNRVAYKKELVKTKKIKVSGIVYAGI